MKALLIVPPGVRYLAGPLAGPAALAGVDGEVVVLDLNARFLSDYVTGGATSSVVGDHAKPKRGLAEAKDPLRSVIEPLLGSSAAPMVAGEDPYDALWYDHEAILRATRGLATSRFGEAWDSNLPSEAPRFVGLSVLFAGQVVPALALAVLARRRWPATPVIMGGPHVTALAACVARDPVYGELIDGFVAGYAEGTFRRMLDGEPLDAPGVFRAGGGQAPRAIDLPGTFRFSDLHLYSVPRLTLPAQTSRGCAFARCTYCTYPANEGDYRVSGLELAASVIEEATKLGAAVSFKDAYIVPSRLRSLADLVDGAVDWSGCTRLVPRLGRATLERLDRAGCRTLEIGVESLDPATLRAVDKRQQLSDLEHLLQDASGTRVHLVLNMMFGFPGQSAQDAESQARWLEERTRGLRVSTERNLLQVQRTSPMGQAPERFGVKVLGHWPWSSSLPWDAPAWRADLAEILTGHHVESA